MNTQLDTKSNAVTISVGCLLILLASYGLMRGIPTTKWPSTKGEVLYASVQEKYVRHDDSYDYSASIAYSYTVNGIQYKGSVIQRGLGEQLKNTKFLNAFYTARKFSKGTLITVFYEPENPTEAVIKRGPDLATYIVLIVGLIFIVLGFNGKSLNIQFKKS